MTSILSQFYYADHPFKKEKWTSNALLFLTNYLQGNPEQSIRPPPTQWELISGRLCWAAIWCRCSRWQILKWHGIYTIYQSLDRLSDVLCLCLDPSISSFYFPLSKLPPPPSNLCDQLCLLLCLHQDVTSNLLVVLTPSLLAISEEDIHYSKSWQVPSESRWTLMTPDRTQVYYLANWPPRDSRWGPFG